MSVSQWDFFKGSLISKNDLKIFKSTSIQLEALLLSSLVSWYTITRCSSYPIVCWVSRLKRKQEVKSLTLSTHFTCSLSSLRSPATQNFRAGVDFIYFRSMYIARVHNRRMHSCNKLEMWFLDLISGMTKGFILHRVSEGFLKIYFSFASWILSRVLFL